MVTLALIQGVVNTFVMFFARVVAHLVDNFLRSRSDGFKAAVAIDLRAQIWPSFAQGQLAAQTHRVFNFENAADAHLMMQQAQHRGKLLLSPCL